MLSIFERRADVSVADDIRQTSIVVFFHSRQIIGLANRIKRSGLDHEEVKDILRYALDHESIAKRFGILDEYFAAGYLSLCAISGCLTAPRFVDSSPLELACQSYHEAAIQWAGDQVNKLRSCFGRCMDYSKLETATPESVTEECAERWVEIETRAVAWAFSVKDYRDSPAINPMALLAMERIQALIAYQSLPEGTRPDTTTTPDQRKDRLDGPHSGNAFFIQGKSVELQPQPWHLVAALWQHRGHSALIEDIRDEVWDGKDVSSSAIDSAISRANLAFAEAASSARVTRKNGFITLDLPTS